MILRAHAQAHREEGQSIVLSVFFLTALIGMAAFVVDAGAWFRASRQVQSVADLNGEFVSVIWHGLPDTTGGVTDYGAHTVFMTQ